MRSWYSPLVEAFDYVESNSDKTAKIVSLLYAKNGFRLADGLNAELKSWLFAAAACESFEKKIAELLQRNIYNSREIRQLMFPFGTDAVLSAYNTFMIFKSDDFSGLVGGEVALEVINLLNDSVPNIVPASHAVRHHHDRMFARVRGKKIGDCEYGQMIRQVGSAMELTDENMQDLVFDFGTVRLVKFMNAVVEHLR